MELEVGVRLTRDERDFTFASTETEAVFILAAHLPGFTKEEIEVAANEGEKQISIRGGGRIACQEAVINTRVAITREVSVEPFDESFPVPERVDWDGIDVWFDEEEEILFISIPKLLMNECSWIREEETAEHLIQEEQRVETQEPTEEEKNGESKLMRPYKGKEKLKEMSGDTMQPSPAEQLQPGTAGVEGPDQVLETELIESKKEYEDIQIEENREIKREKPEVKTADEVLEAELIESEEGRTELPPKESDEEIYEKPMAAEWPEIRKSEIELEGTKDEEPQLTGSEMERRASIETREGYQNVPQKEAKIKQCHEKPTEKPSLPIKEVAEERKSEGQAEKGMHKPEEEWPQENKNLTERPPQEKPKTENLFEPIEPHQKDGKSQLEITDQVMEAKRPTKSQEKEEEMQKQEQEHRELEQLLHGFKDDEDRQIKGPDEEPFRARELLKPKELSLDLYKQKTEKLTLKPPKKMQEAAAPTKTEKEAKVKPKLQQSQEQEVNEQKTPIKVLSYEKMRTIKVRVPKEPHKDLQQYEHEVKEDGKPIEVPGCEKPKAVELPHKEEPKTKAKLHEDEDNQWMDHVKEVSSQEATTLLVSEEEKDKIAIAKMLDIEGMPELQEPCKKPEKSLSVESKKQLKPTQKVEAEERVCPLGAELPDKQAKETSKPESQTKEANKVTESSIPHVESKEHHKPAVEVPYQTFDMTQFKAPDEQERTTPKKQDTKETPERQQRYQQKESKEFEKPVENKIKESRSLKEKEQELQAQQKKEDKTKSHELHQSKEKTERLKELHSVMPTYNDEKEMEIPQSADEEIEQLKSPEQFPKVIKPEKEAQKSMLVKEIEGSVMPKQKRIQLEEEEAPTPQAVLKTHQPEPNHESKHQKPAEKPPYKVSEEQELQEKEVSVHKRPKPRKTNEKEEQQRGQLNRKPIKQEEPILLDSEAEIEKTPNAKTLEINGVLESQEPYKVTEDTLHVEAELQLKLPNEIEAQETLRPAVGAQLPDKLAVRPSERESQNVQQATEASMPLLQPLESKQRKQLEGPRIRLFIEKVSKHIPEQQLNQPDEEQAHKAKSPMQKLARDGAILEPPDSAERTNALMEQELYRYEEGELAQDIESPTILKPQPFPSKHKDRKVLEHDDTAVEPPKPLPIIRVMMETDRSPHLLTMEKKATESTISPPRIRGAVEPERSPLQPSPYDEAIKSEFPALIQKELHTYSDIQKPEKEETASRQMPEFEQAASEQGGKTKEQTAPHIAKIEIERLTDEVPHKIFESPQQEENPPSPFDHKIKTLEVSGDDSEASGAEMDKTNKVKKLSKQRHIHCRCHGRRPAFPIPPSTLLSGSAFVFSIMVLVFHFIKREKSN